ncbi:MAG TPA: NRDE family protein [Limnobacter sp.]|nr:NRDE family protein [Limnobacter sp.]
MCLAALAIDAHPDWPLLVLANRDEFHHRPSAPLHVWPNTQPALLAGKDLQSGGTWLGVNAQGHFALLTNVRNNALNRGDAAPSRGQLVVDALHGLLPQPQQANTYSGFNLIAGRLLNAHGGVDVKLECYSNQGATVPFALPLGNGVHVLSNGHLNEAWPKAKQLKLAVEQLAAQPPISGDRLNWHGLEEHAVTALGSTMLAKDEELPNTGVPHEWEKMLSAVKIVSPVYGTRSSALLALQADGLLHFTEWTYTTTGAVAGKVRLQQRLNHAA